MARLVMLVMAFHIVKAMPPSAPIPMLTYGLAHYETTINAKAPAARFGW